MTLVLDLAHPITNNNLKDVIEWLNEGACVIIHDAFQLGRVYHPHCPEWPRDLAKQPVIYVDVALTPGLLNDGEWDWEIKNATNIQECACALRSHLRDPKAWKRCAHLSLAE